MADSNMRLLSTLAVLQVVTLGLLFLLVLFPPSAEYARTATGPGGAPVAAGPSPVPAHHAAVAPAELKAALRSVLREELEAFAALPARDVIRELPAAAPSPDDLQVQHEAAAVSAAVVQQALSAGVWTAEDTRTVLPHLGRLSEEQRAEIVDRFYTAVNRQQLDLEDVPPL